MSGSFHINGIEVGSKWSPPILFLTAIVLGYLGYQSREQAVLLESEGVVVAATVLSHRTENRSVRDTDGFSKTVTDHYAKVTFSMLGDGTITTEYKVGRDFSQEHPVGSEVPVRYVSAQPSLNELESGNWQSRWQILAFLSAVTLAIGLYDSWQQYIRKA